MESPALIPTATQPPTFWLQGKRIELLFALVLTVLIAGAEGSVYETCNLLRANIWVAHTLQVLNDVEKTYMELRDAEAAQRGYVITGDEAFLPSFQQATEKINDLLTALRSLTADNPRQQQNLGQLEPLIAERFRVAAATVAVRKADGFDAARQRVASGTGTNLSTAVENVINAMKREETGLFQERSQSSNWAAARLFLALSASALTAIGLLVLVYWLVRREAAQRADAAEKFRLVVKSCLTAIVVVDRSGVVSLVNSETEQMFGYQREEIVGRSIEMLIPRRYRPQHAQYIQQFMEGPEARRMGVGRDLNGLRKDGSEFPVKIGLHPMPTKDGMLVLSAIVDITERKQREEERRRFTVRLEQSNRELQDFAYVSSHDLQEPLRKIQAFGDRLKAHCNEVLSDEGRDCVGRMQNAAARMRTLIEDLLQFSRVATKAQSYASVDLNDVVREVLEDLEVGINSSGGRVSVVQLPAIDADPLQMRQLFQNLIGNALKFHRPDVPPAIEIRAEQLAGDGDRLEAARCEIIVADNGIGFDNKYAQRIFDMFRRLHDRDRYQGSGIGLSICRKIVERHSGSITAQGRPSKGATFILTLPVHQTVTDTLSDSPPEALPETLQEETPCPSVEEVFNCQWPTTMPTTAC